MLVSDTDSIRTLNIGNTMRGFGIAGLIVSIVLVISALSMDISVPTRNGDRVVNFSLMRTQSNILNIGLVLFIGSIVLVAVGKKPKLEPKVPIPPTPVVSSPLPELPGGDSICPNCKSSIKSDASECFNCKADFTSIDGWKPLPK